MKLELDVKGITFIKGGTGIGFFKTEKNEWKKIDSLIDSQGKPILSSTIYTDVKDEKEIKDAIPKKYHQLIYYPDSESICITIEKKK